MKKGDLVKVVNEKTREALSLGEDSHGIVLKVFARTADVLFFHPKVLGEFIIRSLSLQDLLVESETLPQEIEKDLFSDLDKVYAKAKTDFTVIPYKVGDEVRLTVEEERYARYGIHKGAIGCVVDDAVVAGKVEVDFFEPEEAAAYDSTIAVKTSDLKKL